MSPEGPGSVINALTAAVASVRASADVLAHGPHDPPSRVIRDLRMADGLIGRALLALVEWTQAEDDRLP